MYKLYEKIFGLEAAFRLFVGIAAVLNRIPFARPLIKAFNNAPASLRTNVFDILFESPVGLGPGLDRNCQLYDIYAALGFSYINVGPLDSGSVKAAISHIQSNKPDTIISCCINADYLMTFSLAYDFMDMFVIDVPICDAEDVLGRILDARLTYDAYKPILLRIPHDFPELDALLHFCRLNGLDGFVVNGTQLVKRIDSFCSGRVPIIGYGGISNAVQALEMLSAGASLVELRTGLVLEGTSMVRKMYKIIEKQLVSSDEN